MSLENRKRYFNKKELNMILRPSKKTFGIEGSIEIQEKNVSELVRLYNDKVIDKIIFDKMLKIITGNESKRSL
jgi:hypothetical protein